MKTITPHLWFDKEAKEAVEFYTKVFPNSKLNNTTVLHEVPTPTGDCDILSFELSGMDFMAINAGPLFKFNPSISFIINFDPSQDANAKQNLDVLWAKLAEGGQVLMPLDNYPFSDRYGWIQDKYGLSWQLILTKPAGEKRPFITPSLLFVGAVAGRAEEAASFYLSIFKDSKQGFIARYDNNMPPNKEGSIMFMDFMLDGIWFAAMDSAHAHNFAFNEAISFMIPCQTQQQIDYYWQKLSYDPKSEQCGWVKDKFGVSWQVYPTVMAEMFKKGEPEQIARVTKAFLPMKKFNIAELQCAFEGKPS